MIRELEVSHCRAILAVAEHQGVSSAARSLGIAQSTLSETLLALERIFGFAVTLRRAGTRTRLTPRALDLLPLASAVVAAADRTVMAAAALGAGASLRVGTVESISSYVLPQVTEQLRQSQPGARIEIVTGMCDQLREAVAAGSLDVAFTLDPDGEALSSASYVRRSLARSRMSVVCAPDDTLANDFTAEALAERLLLLPDAEGVFPQVLKRWLDKSSVVARLDSAGSLDAVKRGIRAQTAVGVLPFHAVAEEIARGRLREVRPRSPLPELLLESVLPKGSTRLVPLLRDLLELMSRTELLARA